MSLQLTVEGMSCGHCVTTVTNALSKVAGVCDVEVNLAAKSAIVRLFDGWDIVTTTRALLEQIEDCGFDGSIDKTQQGGNNNRGCMSNASSSGNASPIYGTFSPISSRAEKSIKMWVQVMHCTSCERWVREALVGLKGISTVSTNLVESSVFVEFDVLEDMPGLNGRELVREALHGAGYGSKAWEDHLREGIQELERLEVSTTRSTVSAPTSESPQTERVCLVVEGMSCAACASRVEAVLEAEPSTESAFVNFLTGKATVTLVPGAAAIKCAPDLVAAVVKAGYAAAAVSGPTLGAGTGEASVELLVAGMVCDACPLRLERALGAMAGVRHVKASLLSGRVEVAWEAAGPLGPRAFVAAANALGYGAALTPASSRDADSSADRESRRYRTLFFASLALTTPLFLLTMVVPSTPLKHALMRDLWVGTSSGAVSLSDALAFAFATSVQLGVGRGFYERAGAALAAGGTNMDVLIALGTSVSYAYSVNPPLLFVASSCFCHSATRVSHYECPFFLPRPHQSLSMKRRCP
jgi:Cu+-exporting ATPase